MKKLQLFILKFLFASIFADFYQDRSQYISETINSISDVGDDVISRNVPSHVNINNHVQCSFECTQYSDCLAFKLENNSCILFGNNSLPHGIDVYINTPTVIYRKQFIWWFNGLWFSFGTGYLNWMNAEQYCIDKYGGNLAAIYNQDVQEFIERLISGKPYMYLNMPYLL